MPFEVFKKLVEVNAVAEPDVAAGVGSGLSWPPVDSA